MLRWWDIEQTLSEMELFRRRVDELYEAFDGTARDTTGPVAAANTPQAEIRDTGEALLLTADLPGVALADIDLQITPTGLSITGQRQIAAPDGFTPHRQERRAYRFSRRFALPVKVDADATKATLESGVLTIHLPKAKDAQPRRITVAG